MVYVVGGEQSLHFRQLFQTAKLLGYNGEYVHASHGLVKLPGGNKMSARAGDVIGLNEVLDEAKQRSLSILQSHNSSIEGDELHELAEIIAIGALKFNDLSQNRRTDITFDWEKMLSFEGFSAPFLQYSAVRCFSILRKAKVFIDEEFVAPGILETMQPEDSSVLAGIENPIPEDEDNPLYADRIKLDQLALNLAPEIALAKKILRFSAAAQESAEKLEPHHLAKYLFELAGEFNRFYAECSVLNAEEPSRSARLYLTKKTGKTLKQGLYLLGIKTPKRM